MKTLPYYWRLSAFYLFYFGSIGAFLPYWALYLHTLGFNAVAIGELIAILLALKIIAPNISGWIADHTGRHIALVRLSSLLAALFFIPLLIVEQSYLWLALIIGVFSFFWHAALPPFEATTLAHLGKQAHRYSQIRLWGSIGFILTVTLFGWLFEYISVTLLPNLLIGLFTGIWLTSLLVPEKETAHQFLSSESFYQVIKQPSAIALFSVCFLIITPFTPFIWKTMAILAT